MISNDQAEGSSSSGAAGLTPLSVKPFNDGIATGGLTGKGEKFDPPTREGSWGSATCALESAPLHSCARSRIFTCFTLEETDSPAVVNVTSCRLLQSMQRTG